MFLMLASQGTLGPSMLSKEGEHNKLAEWEMGTNCYCQSEFFTAITMPKPVSVPYVVCA